MNSSRSGSSRSSRSFYNGYNDAQGSQRSMATESNMSVESGSTTQRERNTRHHPNHHHHHKSKQRPKSAGVARSKRYDVDPNEARRNERAVEDFHRAGFDSEWDRLAEEVNLKTTRVSSKLLESMSNKNNKKIQAELGGPDDLMTTRTLGTRFSTMWNSLGPNLDEARKKRLKKEREEKERCKVFNEFPGPPWVTRLSRTDYTRYGFCGTDQSRSVPQGIARPSTCWSDDRSIRPLTAKEMPKSRPATAGRNLHKHIPGYTGTYVGKMCKENPIVCVKQTEGETRYMLDMLSRRMRKNTLGATAKVLMDTPAGGVSRDQFHPKRSDAEVYAKKYNRRMDEVMRYAEEKIRLCGILDRKFVPKDM